MAHVDEGAHGGIAFRQLILYAGCRAVFDEGDHHWGGVDFHAAAAHRAGQFAFVNSQRNTVSFADFHGCTSYFASLSFFHSMYSS